MRVLFGSAWLACGVLICLFAQPASSAWDDVLREANNKEEQPEPAPPEHTKGLAIDGTERLDVPAPADWSSVLTGKDGKNSKDVEGLLGKIAQIDAMLPDSSEVKAVLMSQFAVAFLHLGDLVQAEQLSLRSLRMAERLTGSNSEETLMCLNSSFLIYEQIGDHDRALEMAQNAHEICERKPELRAKHEHGVLALLASAQLNCGLLADADKNSGRALTLVRGKPPGSTGLLLVKPLDVRASTFMARGLYEQAIPLLLEALELVDRAKTKPKSSDRLEKAFETSAVDSSERATLAKLFRAYLNAGDLKKAASARDRYEAALKSDSESLPAGMKSLKTLQDMNLTADSAVLERLAGNESKALGSAKQYIGFHKRNLSNALMLVESQRLNWQKENLSFSLPAAFCSPSELADIVFSWKGVVLDSLSRDKNRLRVSRNPKDLAKLEKLGALRRQLAQMLLQNPESSDNKTELLKNQIFGLERELSKASARVKTDVTPPDPSLEKVKTALPPNAALIEFITYRELPDIRNGRPHYGALVVTRDADPLWLPLGPAAGIDAAVRDLNQKIQSAASDDALTGAALDQAYAAAFSKIAAALPPSVESLFIGPDGILNFLSFACLRNPDGAFLGEKYAIGYVGSGRDLLKSDKTTSSPSVSVFANPDFGALASNTETIDRETLRSFPAAEFAQLQLPPLPGSEAEAIALRARSESAGWPTDVLIGEEATEEKLNGIKSPAILHLATHGFFLNGDRLQSGNSESTRGMSVVGSNDFPAAKSSSPSRLSPMLLSGIALTGAQSTLKSWAERKAPPSENDGIITAEEVASLDLEGTWLAALSACETGIGEVRSGEGVFGLRRAFMVAGAQNLLMTLWPVSDETTALIMGDFYKEAFGTGDAVGSLAKVQRDWLVKLRNEKGLLSAVRDAGPFAMVVMSSPERMTITAQAPEKTDENTRR